MSLNKSFFERETNIKATVVCDSISEDGHRITTLEIEYPRFILAELNTHKALEKNSSSSRAIPIIAMIKQIQENMGVPVYWGKAKSGMQADGELDEYDVNYCKHYWDASLEDAINYVSILDQNGLHKQTANRLLEPFQMMKTVITGTDWDNFFNLRLHPDAQPEFCMLAYKMYQAMQESTPVKLVAGQWHLPYVDSSFEVTPEGHVVQDSIRYHVGEVGTESFKYLTLEEAQRVSASCTAQTSYRKSDDSLEKADKVFDLLVKADVLHASPFGHLATPVQKAKEELMHMEMFAVIDLDVSINIKHLPTTWEKGVTHMRRDGTLCSGNLAGWISYRHLLPNNTCWEFDFDKRMELFE